MNKRFRSWLAAAVLTLFAVPIALEFNPWPPRVGSNDSTSEVPQPFDDLLAASSLPIADSLTTESDAMTQLTFAVDSQQFSFDDSRPEAYSDGLAIDLPNPSNDPTRDLDWSGSNIDLDAKLFANEYSHLVTALSFGGNARNFGGRAAPGRASNSTPASNHQTPESNHQTPTSNPQTPASDDQAPAPDNQTPAPNHETPTLVTSPDPAVSVPEPATSLLFGVALVLGFSTLGRRKRA